MLRIIIATVVGAIVLFVWGMLAWMALPIHDQTIAGLPDEDGLTAAFEAQQIATGTYLVPAMPNQQPGAADEPADPEAANEAWMAKHRQGPIAVIYFSREGSDPMSPKTMLTGLGINLVASLLAAMLLSSAANGCCRGYLQRVGFVVMLGVFAGVISHGSLWNWMHFPTDWTIAMIADMAIGWTLVGLVMGAIIKPSANRTAA